MHILLSIEHFTAMTGGAESFAVAVANQLVQRGHRLTIVACDGSGSPGLDLHAAPHSQWPELVAKLGPDITLDWGLNIPADVHRLGGGVHRAFMRYNLHGRSWSGRLLKQIEHQLAPKHRRAIARERHLLTLPGTRCVAVSRFVADQVLTNLPVDPTHLTVLLNGVDTGRFRPGTTDERRQARRQIGLADDDIACLFVAHNLRLKNLPLMTRVFARIHGAIPTLKLVVVGKRRPAGHPPWLLYAGMTSQPECLYRATDMLVHPTFYDACANVVLEAMATALPVVSSDQNGSAELIDHQESGFVLPVRGDPEAVARQWQDTIQMLAQNPVSRQVMGQKARDAAVEHSMDRYTDRLEALLIEVAARHAPPRLNRSGTDTTA